MSDLINGTVITKAEFLELELDETLRKVANELVYGWIYYTNARNIEMYTLFDLCGNDVDIVYIYTVKTNIPKHIIDSTITENRRVLENCLIYLDGHLIFRYIYRNFKTEYHADLESGTDNTYYSLYVIEKAGMGYIEFNQVGTAIKLVLKDARTGKPLIKAIGRGYKKLNGVKTAVPNVYDGDYLYISVTGLLSDIENPPPYSLVYDFIRTQINKVYIECKPNCNPKALEKLCELIRRKSKK